MSSKGLESEERSRNVLDTQHSIGKGSAVGPGPSGCPVYPTYLTPGMGWGRPEYVFGTPTHLLPSVGWDGSEYMFANVFA